MHGDLLRVLLLRAPAVCILGTWVRPVPLTWGLCDLQLLVPVLFGFTFYSTWHFIPCPGEVLSVERVCSEFLSMRTGVHQALSCGTQSGIRGKEGFLGLGKSPRAELSSESDLTRIVNCAPAAPARETMRDLENSQERVLPFPLFLSRLMECRPLVGLGRSWVSSF